MKILKVINNNNVCVLDGDGSELILSGKGLGFGKKYGDEVDASLVSKTYVVTDREFEKKLISLLKEIPTEYMNFTSDIVEHIKSVYRSRLNESLIVTLSDHIAFAIERKKNDMEFSNPLLESIREAYPEELELGRYCVREMQSRLGVSMSEDEAGFIAMHIIGARLDTKVSDVYDITKLINGCIETSEHCLGGRIDRETPEYERFFSHLKYLAQRLFQGKPLPAGLAENGFGETIKKSFFDQYAIAEQIGKYIFETYKKDIGEDELLALTIHLKRVSKRMNA